MYDAGLWQIKTHTALFSSDCGGIKQRWLLVFSEQAYKREKKTFDQKLEKQDEALMMVMTLCLMIYNVSQYRLRSMLKEKNETLPNQINKPIQNPTMRWIFQIMEGIGMIRFYEKNLSKPIREMITNLTELRQKIIKLFGGASCRIYGIS